MAERAVNATIIGAGPVGLATALYLRKAGLQVAVIDRSSIGDGSAASAAVGSVCPDFDDIRGRTTLKSMEDLYLKSKGLFDGLPETVKRRIEYTKTDYLEIATDKSELDSLVHNYGRAGIDCEILTPKRLVELYPVLAENAAGALRLGSEVDHQVNPVAFISWLAEECRKNGVVLVENAEVRRISGSGKNFCVEYNGCSINSEYLINAAGSHATEICEMVDPGLYKINIEPVKGCLVTFTPVGVRIGVHLLTSSGSIAQLCSGRISIGGGLITDGNNPWGTDVENNLVDFLVREARLAVPVLADVPVEKVSVGHRPATSDLLPVIGRVGDSNFIIASGLYRTGVTNALGVGKMVAELITAGAQISSDFSPDRFLRR